jgi:hypothetical protein
MAKSEFHCKLCKNVGGKRGYGMYKCVTSALCAKAACEVADSPMFRIIASNAIRKF